MVAENPTWGARREILTESLPVGGVTVVQLVEISKYYDRWRVQPFGPGIAIEHHAAVFAPHGQIRQCCSETQNRDYLL